MKALLVELERDRVSVQDRRIEGERVPQAVLIHYEHFEKSEVDGHLDLSLSRAARGGKGSNVRKLL